MKGEPRVVLMAANWVEWSVDLLAVVTAARMVDELVDKWVLWRVAQTVARWVDA